MSKNLSSSPREGRSNESTQVPTYVPRADIFEKGNFIGLLVELPGVPREDVELLLEGRVLTVRGRRPCRQADGYRQLYSEYGEGSFERAFVLSEGIDEGSVEAEYHNGLLFLRIPKPREEPKQIEIKANQ